MTSQISLNITGLTQVGESFLISVNDNDYVFTFVTNRQQSREIPISDTISGVAQNISSAITNDLGLFEDVSISIGNTIDNLVVAVSSNELNTVFSFNSTSENISALINNISEEDVLRVLSEEKTAVNNNLYRYEVVTNKTLSQVRVLSFPRGEIIISITAGNSDFFTTNITLDSAFVNLQRNNTYSVVFTASDGSEFTRILPNIHILDSGNISQRVNRVSGGYNITFAYSERISDLQWSLDGSDFQSSPMFFNQLEGDHVITVMDSLGYVSSKGVRIAGITGDAYFLYSELNSIRGAKQEDIDNILIHKNIRNTLSYQEDCKSVHEFIYEFLPTDNVRLQFKTNYSDVLCKAIGSNTFDIEVVKKSNNLNQEVALEASVSVIEGRTFISFISGSFLDYEDLNTPLSSYVLNGNLPFWATIGAIIEVNGLEYEVRETFFDIETRINYLIIDSDVQLEGDNVPVRCRYNLKPYEVYEIDVPLLSFLEMQCFQINIELRDSNFTDLNFLTEKIRVANVLKNHKHIVWRHLSNNDVDYSTGIYHTARMSFNKQSLGINQSQEVFDSDTNSYLIDSKNISNIEIEFNLLPTGVSQALLFALSSEQVFIDGVGYAKEDSFEKEGALDESNLYRLTAKLKETGFVFNVVDFEQSTPLSFIDFDIPNLSPGTPNRIDTGSGLLISNSGFVDSQ